MFGSVVSIATIIILFCYYHIFVHVKKSKRRVSLQTKISLYSRLFFFYDEK